MGRLHYIDIRWIVRALISLNPCVIRIIIILIILAANLAAGLSNLFELSKFESTTLGAWSESEKTVALPPPGRLQEGYVFEASCSGRAGRILSA